VAKVYVKLAEKMLNKHDGNQSFVTDEITRLATLLKEVRAPSCLRPHLSTRLSLARASPSPHVMESSICVCGGAGSVSLDCLDSLTAVGKGWTPRAADTAGWQCAVRADPHARLHVQGVSDEAVHDFMLKLVILDAFRNEHKLPGVQMHDLKGVSASMDDDADDVNDGSEAPEEEEEEEDNDDDDDDEGEGHTEL
jgi:hypothetical protein